MPVIDVTKLKYHYYRSDPEFVASSSLYSYGGTPETITISIGTVDTKPVTNGSMTIIGHSMTIPLEDFSQFYRDIAFVWNELRNAGLVV